MTCAALGMQTIVAMLEQSRGSVTRNVVLLYFPVLAIAFSAVLSSSVMSRLAAQVSVIITFVFCLLMLQWVTWIDQEMLMTIGGHLLATISATLWALIWLRSEPQDTIHPDIDHLLRLKRDLKMHDHTGKRK